MPDCGCLYDRGSLNFKIEHFFLFLFFNHCYLFPFLKGPVFPYHQFLVWMVKWDLIHVLPILWLWGQKINCHLNSRIELKMCRNSTVFISFWETFLLFSLLGGQPLLNMPFKVFFFVVELLDLCIILISTLNFYLIRSKRRQLLNINSKLLVVFIF